MNTTQASGDVVYCNHCGSANPPRSARCGSCGHVHAYPSTLNVRESRSTVIRAIAIYLGLWVPAVLVAALVTLAGLVTVLSAPMWSALSFLLALPAVLVGLKSFRASAISMVVLLLWDIVATSWPHVDLRGFLQSLIDVLLLTSTGMVVLVAVFSPFFSVLGFVRQTWSR
jgi:hypothetical protein